MLLWRRGRRHQMRWSTRLLVGSMLMGFGLFNTVEGIVNHHLLGIHHVNETAPRAQWLAWDLGLLPWGLAMLAVGWVVWRQGQAETAGEPG